VGASTLADQLALPRSADPTILSQPTTMSLEAQGRPRRMVAVLRRYGEKAMVDEDGSVAIEEGDGCRVM